MKWKRLTEFLVLYLGLPTLLLIYRLQIKSLLIPILLVSGLLILFILRRDKTFPAGQFGFCKNCRKEVIYIVLRFLGGALPISAWIFLTRPESFLNLPRQMFFLWLVIMFFYPLVSVYPQELIYRAFFSHRYRSLFRNDLLLIWFSALSFGYVHLIFGNQIAFIMSTIGGFMFARTYHRTNSLLLTAFEHGLWGNFIFTIGLGSYFYSGYIQ